MLAVELQREAPTVGKNQRQRFAPLGLAPSVLHAEAQGKAQAMAALHEQLAAAGLLQLEGRLRRGYSPGRIETTAVAIGYII